MGQFFSGANRRINTGGAPLSAQEIRHALNQGKVTGLLKQLAESDAFRKATDGGVSSKRMDDRECVLRFIAFSMNPPANYDSDSFDLFLNETMKECNEMERFDDLEKSFTRAMNLASRIFGNSAFRKRFNLEDGRHPINKALFEAWSVNLSLLSKEDGERLVQKKDELIHAFIKLMGDKAFEMSVSQGTGSINRVKLRFEKIKTIIQKVLK